MFGKKKKDTCLVCPQIDLLVSAVESQKGLGDSSGMQTAFRVKSLLQSLLNGEAELIEEKKQLIKQEACFL